MVHAARASVNRAVARFILRSRGAGSKGSSTAPPSTRHFLIANDKLLETELTPSVPTPNAFLIAGDFPLFSPTAPRISNRYSKLLEIELTHSQQTRKHFLIATICSTFTPAPPLTHHSSLNTHHCLTSFLFDTNKPHKIIVLVSGPMKTKEKRFSIRYKFVPRDICDLSLLPRPRTSPASGARPNAACLAVPVMLTCPAASGPNWFAWLGMGA